MSQSHCSPVVPISDRQSNRLQNRFDLIQIICYMKFMFVNICKIGLLVLVVQTKQMANTVRRYSLYTTFITSKYFNKATPFIKAGVQWTPLLHELGTAARHYRVGKIINMLRSGIICFLTLQTIYTNGERRHAGTPCNSKLLVKNHALHYNIRKRWRLWIQKKFYWN